MALTITQTKNELDANFLSGNMPMRFAVGSVAFDTSYPTGGESFDPTADLTNDGTWISTKPATNPIASCRLASSSSVSRGFGPSGTMSFRP